MQCAPISLYLLSLFFVSNAIADRLPFHPQSVENLLPKQVSPPGSTRLKIIVSNGEMATLFKGNIGPITVCSKLACYRPPVATSAALTKTSSGRGELITEIAIPFTEVASVHFQESPGSLIGGSISISPTLKLEEGYKGGEIFIVLSKHVGKEIRYFPEAAATGLLRENGLSIYYDPRFITSVDLGLGANITIPAHATLTPQILNVAVHNTGDDFPLLDIFPEIELEQPVQISYAGLIRKSEKSKSSVLAAPRIKDIRKTGVVRLLKNERIDAPNSLARETSVSALSTSECLGTLGLADNKQVITNALAANGTAYIDWCVDKPPYVHIAVSTGLIPNAYMTMLNGQLGPFGYKNVYPALPLQRISSYNASYPVVINGFTWTGDAGITAGWGVANGFLSNGGTVYGTNRYGGGATIYPGSSVPDGNKIVMITQPGYYPGWAEGAVGPLFINYGNLQSSNQLVISSSTAIVKGASARRTVWKSPGRE